MIDHAVKKVLVAGASGATGRLLTAELLKRGHLVTVIVRTPEKLPEKLREDRNLTLIRASLLDLSDAELAEHLAGCDAAASCLGHNLDLKGIYGPPHKLVTEAVRRLCKAIKANAPGRPIRFVLMNTTGNRNRDLKEPISFAEKLVIGLIRVLVPPQADNEQAADYLRSEIGQQDAVIEWVVVRPDTLIDEEEVSEYEAHPSPVRSAIFDPGETSRINVGHFMAALISEDRLWQQWKGRMPVIYNRESVEG